MSRLRIPAAAAALLAATAAAAEPPAVGSRILWQDMEAALPGPTWTVTAADAGMVEVTETDAGTVRRIRIAAGLFPALSADGTITRFDPGRLAALPPLEPGRVVAFEATEDGPAGTARWFVHVAVADRRTEATPAGAHAVLVIEHHRRGTGPDGQPAETLTEWAVAPALGLPVAIRSWRIAGGRPTLLRDRRALAVLPP